MNAESKSNVGKAGVGFGVRVTVEELSDAQQKELINRGLRWSVQRISGIDFALGIAKKVGKKTIRSGKRGDVSFSADVAEKLKREIEDGLMGDEDLFAIVPTVEISLAEGQAQALAFKEERATLAEAIADGKKIDDIKKTIGFDGEVFVEEPDEDGAYDYSVEFLSAFKKYLDAKWAEMKKAAVG